MTNLSLFPLALIQSAIMALAQVMLKFGLQRMAPFGWNATFWRSALLNWQFACSGLCFGVASLLWMYIIKHYPLSLAYPMVSLSYVFAMLSAIFFFHEHVDLVKWIGVLLIMIGCTLIAKQ
ncbi:MAG: GRP family sugar transporter [Bacteroidales bacterium]|nr:GRP family sugar transporter [Bacteroidales bacterium]